MNIFQKILKRKIDYIQELYCDNCKQDTEQKVRDGGHERDSSSDKFECTRCGRIKYGITGKWQKYN